MAAGTGWGRDGGKRRDHKRQSQMADDEDTGVDRKGSSLQKKGNLQRFARKTRMPT